MGRFIGSILSGHVLMLLENSLWRVTVAVHIAEVLIFASNDVRLSVLVIRESSWDFLGNCMSVRDSYIKYGKL
jgi:hypothetical protein